MLANNNLLYEENYMNGREPYSSPVLIEYPPLTDVTGASAEIPT